jgi:hypothetical protein
MKGVKTGGRSAGTPNKATVDVRAAIAIFAQENVERMSGWLNDIDDPAKRLDLYLRALEYHVPKLGRTEHTGEGGGDIVVRLSPTDGRL